MDVSTGSEPRPLDRIDRELLDYLQRDGRLTIAELARRVNLSPTPCLERVRRLERDGYIRDYVARLDPKRLGLPVVAFIELALDKTPLLSEQFPTLIRDFPEIEECHMIAGGFDYLLKVRTASMDAFRRFLGERLTTLPGIAQTHTYFSLEQVKGDGLLPIAVKRGATRRASATATRG